MENARIADLQTVNWQMKVGQLGAVVEDLADVEQSIQLILMTPRGSAPLRPEFGSDVYLSIDAPPTVAGPAMVAAAHEAVKAWEPRAAIERVVPHFRENGIELEVQWRPAGDLAATLQNTRVRL